ncbi:hypothetical protein [Bifidobacterium margollesii]|nr:hypothetical protein [Bifidobacterium margollesii]
MNDILAERYRNTLQRCLDETRRFHRSILFSLTTALALHMVPIPQQCSIDTEKLHAVASTRNRRIQSQRMAAHVWSTFDTTAQIRISEGVYALDLVHTWAHMARFVPLDQFIALTDAILLRMLVEGTNDPLSTLRSFLDRTSFRGQRICRKALMLARLNVLSPPETLCRLTLLQYGIPAPETNYTVPGMRFRSGAPGF